MSSIICTSPSSALVIEVYMVCRIDLAALIYVILLSHRVGVPSTHLINCIINSVEYRLYMELYGTIIDL